MRLLHEQGFFLFTMAPLSQMGAVKDIIAASGVSVHMVATTLPQCLGCLSQADLLITIDTGQTHLAAALKLPVLSLSGLTTTSTYPYTRCGIALAAASNCFDCRFASSCPSNKKVGIKHAEGYIAPCMRHLKADTVYEWAMRMLENPGCELPPYFIDE